MAAVRHWWSGLFAKYVAFLVGLVTLVLAFNGGLEVWLMYRDTRNGVERREAERAAVAAQRIEHSIDEIERQIAWVTRASAGPEQRRADYAVLMQQLPAVEELIQLDGSGKAVLAMSRSGTRSPPGADFSKSAKFTEAAPNRMWFGPIYFRNGTDPFMTITMGHAGQHAGVTVAEINLEYLDDVIKDIRVGMTRYLYVVSPQGAVLAHSPGHPIKPGTDVSKLPQVEALLAAGEGTAGMRGMGRDLRRRPVLGASARVPRVNWYVLVEQPVREALRPLLDLLVRLAWVVGLGFVVAAGAGVLMARRMVVPIRALQTSASKFAANDFEHRIDIHTGDELEALGSEFNRMAGRLQESYSRLEQKVEERTRDLEQSVGELRALEEIARALASSLELGAVLETIVARAVELAGADAGAIFRYEPAERSFRLAEAVGVDADFADKVRATPIAEKETVMGESAARREPMSIPDLAAAPEYPLRDAVIAAGFHSVLIVPLVGTEEILGSLLAVRKRTGDFSPNTVTLMRRLADQSVLAMHNARLFREIAEKSRQLGIASQHKSQFLANMSHELRTPLNAVLGYAELLLDGLYGELPEKAVRVLERMQANGKHLLGLINDVLDLSKIEAGQFKLALEDYSIKSVVNSVVAATESLAQAKGLELATEVAPDLPTGCGDERRLTQVLLNIVSNAVKFTEQGRIDIHAEATDGYFHLAVRDTGPGIAPEDQARIFEEFQQVDNSLTRQKGGTGLGLAISKHLIEMHGGSLTLESALGSGSTFHIHLPVHAAAPDLAAE
jgi:signal transduction histidine kinase